MLRKACAVRLGEDMYGKRAYWKMGVICSTQVSPDDLALIRSVKGISILGYCRIWISAYICLIPMWEEYG